MDSFALLPSWRKFRGYHPIPPQDVEQAQDTGSNASNTQEVIIDPVKAGKFGLFLSLFVLSCFAVLALITQPTVSEEASSTNEIVQLGRGRHLFAKCHTHCKDECGYWKVSIVEHGGHHATHFTLPYSAVSLCLGIRASNLLHYESLF
ncbi:hypothetical protein EON65_51150 [archaeon]|nr:MAG: hypothetical protein EON65_51150 [archaeon]